MKLKSLYIKNFKALKNFEVKKLGRLNLIVGKNNSGKSTVLEALRIYSNNGSREVCDVIAEEHDEYILKNTASSRPYESFFTYGCFFLPGSENPRDSVFSIEIGENEKSALVFSMTYLPEGIRNLLTEGIPTVHNSRDKNDPCSYVPTQWLSLDELARDWDDLALINKEKLVKEGLKKFQKEFEDLIFVANDRNAKSKRLPMVQLSFLAHKVPLASLGDGMRRILQLALKIVFAQGGFLLIDEFENGLHYSLQEDIWDWLFDLAEELDVQVFATTHSWDTVNSFINVGARKQEIESVLFRVGKSALSSNKDQVIATEFNKEELLTLTQANMELR